MALENSCPSAGDIGEGEPPREPDPDAAYERERMRRHERTKRLDAALGGLVDDMEGIDWRAVPTFSTDEAAALTARIDEAREALRERGLDGGR